MRNSVDWYLLSGRHYRIAVVAFDFISDLPTGIQQGRLNLIEVSRNLPLEGVPTNQFSIQQIASASGQTFRRIIYGDSANI